MPSTAAPHPIAIEAPELCCDEIAAWLDDVLTILDATSAVAPFGSVGLRQWVLDQLAPVEAVVPWLVTEVAEADIDSHRFQDAGWLLVRAETTASRLRARLRASPLAA